MTARLVSVLALACALCGCNVNAPGGCDNVVDNAMWRPCWWRVIQTGDSLHYVIYARVYVATLPDTLRIAVPQ